MDAIDKTLITGVFVRTGLKNINDEETLDNLAGGSPFFTSKKSLSSTFMRTFLKSNYMKKLNQGLTAKPMPMDNNNSLEDIGEDLEKSF